MGEADVTAQHRARRAHTDREPALISAEVLGYWLGSTVASEHLEATTGAAELVVPDEQPEGFVSATPLPEPGRVVLLDVRWQLGRSSADAHEAYRQGHIPGAVYVTMDGQLAGHGGPSAGRHPLPSPEKFSESLKMLGIHDEGTIVVVYDDTGSDSAARAWWLLRHAGIRHSYVLDGGLTAWLDEGCPLQPGDVLPVIGTARGSWDEMPEIGTNEIPEFLSVGGVLLDARATERYTGEEEPVDPVAGHIPGAVSAPLSEVKDDSGRYLPAEQLRAYFNGKIATPDAEEPPAVAAYCGSGVSASGLVLALYVAGYDAALYPGSFSAWANTQGAEVATGPEPGSLSDAP